MDGWERDESSCSQGCQVLITSTTELHCFPFPRKQSSCCLLLCRGKSCEELQGHRAGPEKACAGRAAMGT